MSAARAPDGYLRTVRNELGRRPAGSAGVAEIVEIPGRGHALTIDSG